MFEFKLKELREDFEGRINGMRIHNRQEFAAAEKRLFELEDAISKEVEDRVIESDELILETREDLGNLQS